MPFFAQLSSYHRSSLWRSGGLLIVLAIAGCQPRPTASEAPERSPPISGPTDTTGLAPHGTSNPSPDCVTDYDPAVDYFPDKSTIRHATGFTVEYHNHYKRVTVTSPWPGATDTFEYVLVQCGTPTPDGYDQAQIVPVPIRQVAVLSTTHLPHLDQLDQVDALVGVNQFNPVSNPAVRAKIDRGDLTEFASGTSLNIERLLVAAPDLVMTYGTGNPDTDDHPRLIAAGLPVALVAEYREPTPLGQAEWLKFTASFFNAEAKAEQVFDTIAGSYADLVAMTQDLDSRPTVLTGSSYQGTWYVSGGKTHLAQLIHDAGGDYLWADDPSTGNLPLDVEAVFDRAATADIWINAGLEWTTLADAIAADPRYGKFQALQTGAVFNNNARLNGLGGNDYWESGIVSPHLILADLIHIFHPDLLPDHPLNYYRPLEP